MNKNVSKIHMNKKVQKKPKKTQFCKYALIFL